MYIGYHGGRRKAGSFEVHQQGSSPPVFVAVIYRPPDAELINSDLAEALEQNSVGFAYQIVMGDLNANMLVTEQESTFVKHLACQLNLKFIEHGATNQQNGKSNTWIDVIFTDDDDVMLDSNNMTATNRNSHNIIVVVIDLPVSQKPPLGRFTYRNFKAIKITGLNTQYLDITPLGENTSLPAASIFINESFDKKSYLEFQNLKSLAKRLQIKYIRHRRGRYLARMRDGERMHTFSSPTDLQAGFEMIN